MVKVMDCRIVVGWLFEFPGTSTTIGYSMPNLVYIYELYMTCNHFFIWTHFFYITPFSFKFMFWSIRPTSRTPTATSEFVLQLRYYVHFRANTLGKDMNPLILPAMGLNSTITVLLRKNGFVIEWPIRIDMPLNKETKPNLWILKSSLSTHLKELGIIGSPALYNCWAHFISFHRVEFMLATCIIYLASIEELWT